MEILETKHFIPKGFELGTTLVAVALESLTLVLNQVVLFIVSLCFSEVWQQPIELANLVFSRTYFSLNPDYVAARSLSWLHSKKLVFNINLAKTRAHTQMHSNTNNL